MPRPWEPGRSEGEYGPRPIAQPGYRADTTIERLATTLQFLNLLLPAGLFNQLDVRGRRPVARQIDAESALGARLSAAYLAPGGGAKLAPAESLQSRGHAGRGVLPNSGTPSPRILSTI